MADKSIGKFIVFSCDDTNGDPRTMTGDITSVGELGNVFAEVPAGGFGQDENNLVGIGANKISIEGFVTTTALVGTHTVFAPLSNPGNQNIQITITISFGNNATPDTGDIEMTGEYVMTKYTPTPDMSGAITFAAEFVIFCDQVLPTWGTVT